ncbi:MAG TPA: hypothetical protein VLQ89_02225, partial [Candidatus Binatia bacterium]|nr:hypothetical protein [Candidatus Binatia bacterium]
MKRMVLAIVVLSLLAAAGSGLAAAEKSDFAGAYDALQADIEKKMASVTSRDAYEKLMSEKKSGLEGLLAAYATEADSDAGQLLCSRVLIDLKRYAEAEVKLDALLAKKSPLQTESTLYKAKILTETEKTDLAVPLFREIEAALPRSNDFFAVAIALAFEASDDMVKREYSRKVIEAKDLPAKFSDYRLQLVMNLASLEVKLRKIDLAKKILQDGIDANPADANTKWLRSSLKQLDFINQPAPAIAAENWLNSEPLALEALKGKVV